LGSPESDKIEYMTLKNFGFTNEIECHAWETLKYVLLTYISLYLDKYNSTDSFSETAAGWVDVWFWVLWIRVYVHFSSLGLKCI
jgi:hypothetical protein